MDDYVLTLRGLREKYADKLHIRIGLEAEYFPAYLGWLREEMERLDIEYLILGCHYDTTDEQDARASRFGGSTSTAHGRRYAEQVVEALETGLYRVSGPPRPLFEPGDGPSTPTPRRPAGTSVPQRRGWTSPSSTTWPD